jgi:hypothetical protein
MKNLKVLVAVFIFSALPITVRSQTTAFTYQGKLSDSGSAPTAPYDFTFRLFSQLAGGSQIGSDVLRDDVQVTAGVFSVNLDFGSSPFTSSTGNFLEILVRPGASTGAYTLLIPRNPITATPYAVETIRAASAAVADNALQLGGVNAGQFVQTMDARLSDARSPTAGSTNYVQNTSLQQPGSNFNVSGTGTANVFDATTQFNIGGSRMLGGSIGNENIYVGPGAGQSNSGLTGNSFFGSLAGQNNAGGGNSFFGRAAGRANTSTSNNSFFGFNSGAANISSSNSFFGSVSGQFNTTGANNSFFGTGAGQNNGTGSNNAFFGNQAGSSNTSGNGDTIIGFSANVSGSLSNATAIGANAIVSQSYSMVLGGINGVNGASGDTNVGIGTTAPQERLHVVGNGIFTGNLTVNGALIGILPAGSSSYIQNSSSPQVSSNFNISGTGTANIINATTQYNLGGNRILAIGSDSTYLGLQQGIATLATSNTFFGSRVGQNNTGINNSFFGATAGQNNLGGGNNSFFGANAGRANLGQYNSFFGSSAGVSSTGKSNSFFGEESGSGTNTGSYNSFFGVLAGSSNTLGDSNTIIGTNANVSSGGLSNTTAIGANAMVSLSNSLVLGSINNINTATADTNVGIGTTAPEQRLHVNGNEILSTGSGAGFKFRDRGSSLSSDDWVWYSNGNIARFFRAGTGDIMTVKTNGNFGIGTANPNTKLQIAGGSVYIANPNSLIITSPNGACWFITVSNAGALSTISVACP